MVSRPRLVTAQELLEMPDDGFRYELVRGELRQYPALGFRQGVVASNIAFSLYNFVDANDLGHVVAGVGFLIESNPDHVRAPSIAFISSERIELSGVLDDYFPGAPDLAIYLVLREDYYMDVYERVDDLLSAGSGMVALVDPFNFMVTVNYPGYRTEKLARQDTLDGGDVVPGWSMPVADIFA